MNNRIFKKLMLLSICVSLNIPTNAAVSVSDSSAFITKSEALAISQSLSERIVNLETNVEDKINVLVASYMQRNGKWRASEQQLINNTAQVSLPDLSELIKNYVTYVYSESMYTKKLIINTSKTGFFTGVLSYHGVPSPNADQAAKARTSRIGYYYKVRRTGNNDYYSYFDTALRVCVDLYMDNSIDKDSHNSTNFKNYSELVSSYVIGFQRANRHSAGSSNYANVFLFLPTPDNVVSVPLYFFVTKNSTIWLQANMYCRFFHYDGGLTVVAANRKDGSDLYIEISDCYIN